MAKNVDNGVLIEKGIRKLGNGKFKATICYNKGDKPTNKSKTFSTIEEARDFRMNFKSALKSSKPKENLENETLPTKKQKQPIFQEIPLSESISDNFIIIITKNQDVVNSIVSKLIG